MAPTIGFVLLTHRNPRQIFRLIETLNRLFEDPRIVCHHDFSKNVLTKPKELTNVIFVQPHVETQWGGFSLVEATIKAFKVMYADPNSPDWVVLLSGSDYPIKSSARILHDLSKSPYDVHISHEIINFKDRKTEWHKMCYSRYCNVKFRIPFLDKKLNLIKKRISLKHPLLTKPFLPFSDNFKCYAGKQWFCCNRKAAIYLTEFHEKNTPFTAHYRRLDSYCIIPDESYCQTIFCNSPHLKVSRDDLRYVDWSARGAHPKTLRLEDLSKIRSSSAHFARKFDLDEDEEIFEEIDRFIF